RFRTQDELFAFHDEVITRFVNEDNHSRNQKPEVDGSQIVSYFLHIAHGPHDVSDGFTNWGG
ncbi:MAG: hypothetical protein ACI9A8_001484, partial [Cryomorphaceae bacterium]